MLTGLPKTLSALLMPGGLILLAAVGYLRPQGLPVWLEQPVAAFPYFVLAFGLVFGWYFSSVRVILSLLVLSSADRALIAFPAAGPDPHALGRIIFAATAVLLPLNLLAFSILKEEGTTTMRGGIRILAVLIQPFLLLWLCAPERRDLAAALEMPYLPWLPTAWTPLPQAALVAFAVAGLLHLVRFTLRRDPLDAGAAWALGAAFLAYHGARFGWRPTNFFAAAGLILFVALIQSCYQRTYRDDLTGIAGRVAYQEATSQLGKRFAVAVLSIDQLKAYGNAHGKAVAEQILKSAAPKVQAACQRGHVFRVSGEELTMLFSDQTALDALVALDNVRKTVGQMSLFLRGRDRVWEDSRGTSRPGGRDRELPVTVSIGVADSSPDSESFGAVIKSAYRALYEAKAAGGNVVKRGIVSPEPLRRAQSTAGRIIPSGEY